MYSIFPLSSASITAAIPARLFISSSNILIGSSLIDSPCNREATLQLLVDLILVKVGKLSPDAAAHRRTVLIKQSGTIKDFLAHRGLLSATDFFDEQEVDHLL